MLISWYLLIILISLFFDKIFLIIPSKLWITHRLWSKYCYLFLIIVNLLSWGVNLYRNSAVWDCFEATVSACAVGVGGRQWQREHPLDTAAEQRDADDAEADGEHHQQRARVRASTSRPSSTSASLRHQHRRWRLLWALGNADTGNRFLAAGGNGGQRARRWPRDERLEDEGEVEWKMEFWEDSSSSLQCFH